VGKRQPKAVPQPTEPWTESEHYAWVAMTLDPNHPNVQRAARVVSEMMWKYVKTHTAEECEALLERAAEQQAIAERLFGRWRPVIGYERQRQWIDQFGLSPVLGYELEDPC
jgi:hypothetical protein